jgi:hypothetical protein
LGEAVEDIRELALKHRLPGSGTAFLWATILAQFAESNSCDGTLANTLEEIIRAYLKEVDDNAIISMWLETETGFGDDSEELIADWVRIDLEMELLDEVTKLAFEEAKKRPG